MDSEVHAMMGHEIPNAYLIRALARREAEHCDGCGSRMFVKGPSGLCPFCLSGHRPRAVEIEPRVAIDEPFAPRLADAPAERGPIGRIVARVGRTRRARRAASTLAARLGLPAGSRPHPSAG